MLTLDQYTCMQAGSHRLPLNKKGLHIYHHNICSLFSKFDELKHLLLNSSHKKVDIYGITETHLSSNISDNLLHIPGYQLFRHDRKTNSHGGVVAYISDHLHVKKRSDLETEGVESLWLGICHKGSKSLFVAFVYRVPCAPVDWYNFFENELFQATKCDHSNLILLGDFNVDLLQSKNSAWPILFMSYGLSQIITKPTSVTANSATLIDHILVSDSKYVQETCCVSSVS